MILPLCKSQHYKFVKPSSISSKQNIRLDGSSVNLTIVKGKKGPECWTFKIGGGEGLVVSRRKKWNYGIINQINGMLIKVYFYRISFSTRLLALLLWVVHNVCAFFDILQETSHISGEWLLYWGFRIQSVFR